MIVMLIEDNHESRECLKNALQLNDFEVRAYAEAEPAIAAYNAETIDLVISDFHLPGTDGLAVLKEIKKKNTLVRMIIISGDPGPDTENNVLQAGAMAFFKKPLNIKQLVDCIAAVKK